MSKQAEIDRITIKSLKEIEAGLDKPLRRVLEMMAEDSDVNEPLTFYKDNSDIS